jgi:hypothetical protein
VVLTELKGGPLGSVWNIGQIPRRNFDWLSFTPPSGRLLRPFNKEVVGGDDDVDETNHCWMEQNMAGRTLMCEMMMMM